MWLEQCIGEFNRKAGNMKMLSYGDEIQLSNQLKAINQQFSELQAENPDTQLFFSSLYNLLCQSSNMKAELLDICLDILLQSVSSKNKQIRMIVLSDCRFLTTLITNIMRMNEDDDNMLLKFLKIIRELLSYNSDLDEHNLRMIIEILRDNAVNKANDEISTTCLHILANLCFDNEAAKYLITRAVKATDLKKKIKNLADNLVKFKFFILIEDEIYSKDVKYFLRMSLKDVTSGTENFSMHALNSSLEILRHFEKLNVEVDCKLSEDEEIVSILSNLNEKLAVAVDSAESFEKTSFFEGIYEFFKAVLRLDPTLANIFSNFVESAFTTAKISRSSSALKFLAEFLRNDGILKSSDIIIESLLKFYAERNTDSQREAIDHCQVRNFLFLKIFTNKFPFRNSLSCD